MTPYKINYFIIPFLLILINYTASHCYETKTTFIQNSTSQKKLINSYEKNFLKFIKNFSKKHYKYNVKKINIETLYTGKKSTNKIELQVLSKFNKLSKEKADCICNSVLINKILNKYSYMSQEQKTAIIGICGRQHNNIDILIGKAGSGKTVTLKAISEIYKESGSRVIGMCLSALAAENLEKQAGIESHSIAYWIYNKWKSPKDKSVQLKCGDVLIVDEAGMIGASEWKKLLNAVEKYSLKLIIVGDNNQFQPISFGNCFQSFLNLTSTSNIFELKEIHRQKINWMKKASILFSKMNISSALQLYKNQNRIYIINNITVNIAQKYLELEKISNNTIILCYTKSECKEINNIIHYMKKERGELGDDIIKVNDKSFSKGEKIMLLKNNKMFKVKNGQTAIIKSIDKSILSIKMESSDEIKNIDLELYDKINYAYAITLHKAQGKTFDNTIVVGSRNMDARAIYVAMTRHTDDVYLYCDKSDFKSFTDFVTSTSKVSHKNSLSKEV